MAPQLLKLYTAETELIIFLPHLQLFLPSWSPTASYLEEYIRAIASREHYVLTSGMLSSTCE